jgi:hypothetical protein
MAISIGNQLSSYLQRPLTSSITFSGDTGIVNSHRFNPLKMPTLFDVTNYVLQEIGADNYSSQKLVMAIGGGDSTLSRFTGNTTAAPSLRSRLIVSMLVYKTQ